MLLLRPNDPRHFLDLRPGKNARNKWHSDVGRARSDARPAAKMGRAVEILPEKYSSITAERNIVAKWPRNTSGKKGLGRDGLGRLIQI